MTRGKCLVEMTNRLLGNEMTRGKCLVEMTERLLGNEMTNGGFVALTTI